MDIQAMQSMDWLFKKERIYLLAQFWQQRATLAEKEVTALKEQLAAANHSLQLVEKGQKPSDMEQTMDLLSRPSVEVELAAKEKEISQLVEDVQRLQSSLAKLQESSATQIARLEEQLDQKTQHIARLEARLETQRDYEEVKRELSILRSIEFPSLPGTGESSNKPLEMLLLERTKALQSENTALKVSNADLQDQQESQPGDKVIGPPSTPTSAPPTSIATATSAAPTPATTCNSTTTPTSVSSIISHHLVNGNPKTPPEESSGSVLCNNNNIGNNNINVNNNIPPPVLINNANNSVVSLREDKSPFRFDDRSPFRFDERLGESLIPKGDPMEARLQEMLRYNMDKYANQNLDTLHIARRVRELLSIHNIGQRLFAKYVLGLSQGTVSELLSKPKPWDKLTEKGRDSYRKMHAWACDENAVMLLKSLIPKKAARDSFESRSLRTAELEDFIRKDSGLPAFARGEDPLTEERIAHILNEANQALKSQVEDSRSNDSKSPNHAQSPSPLGKDMQNRRLKKYENDDIPQEKVVRIYQEELAKLMGRRIEDTMRGPRDHFPSGAPMDRTQEEIRMALDAYHRELAKLNPPLPGIPGLIALQSQNGVAQDLSLPKERKDKLPNGGSDMDLDKKDGTESNISEMLRHAGSAFSLVRPKTEPGQPAGSGNSPLNSILPPTTVDDFSTSSASPLQRMASITNSLISQPSTPSHHSPSQRPLKAVLPPITQQQFDQFNNLNTEDIVKKVKEQLSQYSISQRLFGESVLGLSQGSVSDLLARPKPWHMLTQKGREPFIRMKMFLEDDNAVHKLVASQYKIAPEKLMRTGGYGVSSPACTSKPLPKLSDSVSKAMETPMIPAALAVSQVQLPPQNPLLASPSQPPPESPLLKKQPSLRTLQHMQPSVYEMAALTQDLDTQTITTKIKEALLANNIGQKIFGEAVLGLSQGSVSELLSKPKPWHMLSIKGREPFIRMQLWLNDPHNVEKLQQLKNERREANKRRRNQVADNNSDTSSNDTTDFYHTMPASPGPPSAKKQRVLFSEEQKEALRLAFALDPYPNMATIEFLGQELALSSRTITNWFHNHRMRLKQQVPHSVDNMNVPPAGREGQPFDPVQFRLLLNQRLLELQKERNPALAGLPTLPGQLPYPYFNAAPHLPDKEQISGLDLTMTALKREPDFEADSNAGSDINEDSNLSSSSLRESRDDDGDKHEDKPKVPSEQPASRSRRKPAAPQWVNPEWQELGDEKEKEVIINGVCVMQTDDFDMKEKEEETVRVEPTPVMDHDSEESDINNLEEEESPKSFSKEEGEEVREEEGVSVKDESLLKFVKVDVEETERNSEEEEEEEKTETLVAEVEEKWSSGNKEKKDTIEKLEQRIKREKEDDWEF